MLTDYGRSLGWAYRVTLNCDGPRCRSHLFVDCDRFEVEDNQRDDPRQERIARCLTDNHWVTVDDPHVYPFYEKHFCPDHAPQQ